MTDVVPVAASAHVDERPAPRATGPDRFGWVPTWALITTKLLEIRRRKGLMAAVVVLILGPPVLVLGLRLLFHAVDPSHYGPAGNPGVFKTVTDLVAEFGFMVAAAAGASAATTDLTEGMFRHLVVTGRSRLALYLARIPAGLGILVPLVALSFAMVSLVTSYEGSPSASAVTVNGVTVPVHLDRAQFAHWAADHPRAAASAVAVPGPNGPPHNARAFVRHHISTLFGVYESAEVTAENPSPGAMTDVGLWLELEIGIGFLVGLGLGSLTGQRTVTTILLVALEIIVTPILSAHVIPYFLDGQRVDVGVAMNQLRPFALSGVTNQGGGPRHVLLGGGGGLQIPPMPTWAMVAVIVGWIVGWSVIGTWRMARRDA